ncbi:hypothetical protein, partial [Pseudomonas sp. VE 196-7]|uniref:hypothetical protein n=1 Tax=Pseudomonas sp. VE 196-7 TaxID=2956726 RepID=UPI0021D4F653
AGVHEPGTGTQYPPVGAAEGCDLLILILKNKIKRSQPSAAPTGQFQGAIKRACFFWKQALFIY